MEAGQMGTVDESGHVTSPSWTIRENSLDNDSSIWDTFINHLCSSRLTPDDVSFEITNFKRDSACCPRQDVPIDCLKASLSPEALRQVDQELHYDKSGQTGIMSPETKDENEDMFEIANLYVMELGSSERDNVTSPHSDEALITPHFLSDRNNDVLSPMISLASSLESEESNSSIDMMSDTCRDLEEAEVTDMLGNAVSHLSTLQEDDDFSEKTPQQLEEIETLLETISTTDTPSEVIPNTLYSQCVKTELRYSIQFKQATSSSPGTAPTDNDNRPSLDPNEVIENKRARNRKHAKTSREKRKNTLLELREISRMLEESKHEMVKQIEELKGTIKLLKRCMENHDCKARFQQTGPGIESNMVDATTITDNFREEKPEYAREHFIDATNIRNRTTVMTSQTPAMTGEDTRHILITN